MFERLAPCQLLDAQMTSRNLPPPEYCCVCASADGVATYDNELRQARDIGVASADEAAMIAVVWCNDCFRQMCDNCSKVHRYFCPSHRTVVLNARSTSAAVATAAANFFAADGVAGSLVVLHRCADHGREIEFICSSCGLRCDRCVDDCFELKHCVNAIDSQSVSDAAKHAAEDLVRAAERLRQKMVDVASAAASKAMPASDSSVGRLEAALNAAFRDDDARIWCGTNAALSTITCAFDRTEAALRDAYEFLANRIPAAMPINAVQLRASLSHADAYVNALLDSRDSSSLLDQQHAVRSCLRRLADAADALPPLTGDVVQGGGSSSTQDAAAAWTMLSSEVPQRDFGTMVQPFVGTVRSLPSPVPPTDASGTDVAATVTTLPSGIQTKKNENEIVEMASSTATRGSHQHSGDSGISDAGKEAVAAATQSALLFGPAKTTFRSVSASHDVAATPDGRILLAALSDGLRQYDATGRKLTTWRPPQDDITTERGLVSSVDALADSCAVVAVINTRRVHLLRTDPSDGIWIDYHHYDLWLWPYRVAAAASASGAGDSCLAIVGAGIEQPNGKTTQFGPGQDLIVMLLTSDRRSRRNGDTLFDRKLDYLANAVTLIGGRDVVLVAGELPRGGLHVVEAFRYGMAAASDEPPLWRYETVYDVSDICAAPASVADSAMGLIYMAMADRRHVQWLDAGTGKATGVALIAASGASSPNRLSFCGGGQGLQLVVLAARGIVSVHPLR